MGESEKQFKKFNFTKYNDSKYEDKFNDKYELPVLKTMELESNFKLTVYKGKDDKPQYDLRYFNPDTKRPTIRGVRLRTKHLMMLMEAFQCCEPSLVNDFLSLNEEKEIKINTD